MSKKLRITLIVTLVLCVVVTALTLVACTNDEQEHKHTYGKWDITSATCVEDGKKTRTCTECGKSETKTLDALGHSWNKGEVTSESTCEDDGVMTYTCTRTGCTATYTEEIDAIGHDWQEIKEVTPATCEDDGLRSAVCSRCDAREDEQIIPALGHEWEVEQTATETCQHGGEYLHTCKRTNCGASYTTTTEPVEHKWGSGVTVAAKCESNGSVTYTCEFGCKTQKVDTINFLGHQWGSWTRTSEPNCTEKGSEKHTCTRNGCGKFETRSVAELGHLWSKDYVIDKAPTFEEDGSQSKHCTRNGCNAKDEVQVIPKLELAKETDYTVTIKDPCGEKYYGVATIGFYLNNELVTEMPMADSGVTTVTLSTDNYNVRISGLTEGYFAQEDGYDILATQPQLTICLGASLRPQTNGVKYQIGSILCDFTIYYYEDADSEWQITTFSDILKSKKGILINFYFKGCQPCANEMPSLVSVANTFKDDVQVLMVNEGIRNSSDDDVKYFQRTYANNSPLWFVNISRSRFLYNYFYNLIGGFPTTILIDCNGQIVYSHSSPMSVTGFTSVINTYVINRYNKLHPSTETANYTVESYEAFLPSDKFRLEMSEA